MKILLSTICLLLMAANTAMAERQVININPVWKYATGDPADAFMANYDDSEWAVVSLPHSHRIFTADLRNVKNHGREVGWYRRVINIEGDQLQKKVFVVFQGAMQTTKLWVNDQPVGEYAVSGYDSFHFDITPYIKKGENFLAVRVDNTSRNDIPPDGTKTDFIQFGGLYRDVDLVITDPVHITFPWEARDAGVRLTLPEVSAENAVVQVQTSLRNDTDKAITCQLITRVLDSKGKSVKSMADEVSIPAGGGSTVVQKSEPIVNPNLWSPDNPYLYTVETKVEHGHSASDIVTTRLGIRWVRWDKEEGFFLNGKHLKLVGSNRHQTWPFIGNAVPNSLHYRDAEELKAMGLNWVRLSHYPHDPDFLDDLDELGLMALAEGPTWMKIPSEEWVDNLDKSFRSMIRRDRNHPSIIIWNTCVNHRGKHPRLVQAAIEEDPTRARGQDTVGCPMNFVHKKITGEGALCIEHTGHKFRTRRGALLREYECAKMHWEQTDAAYKVPGNSGLAVWAMYDYNTFHGAPEGIAWHGVLDLFRIPKVSYYWHISELGSAPFTHGLAFSKTKVVVFSNADQVRLFEKKDAAFVELGVRKPDEGYALHHPPFHFDVSADTTSFKAEGLVNGKVVSSHEFHRYGEATALKLGADSKMITADGADVTRVFVKFVDQNGTVNVDRKDPIKFSLSGPGQLVGENPTFLRAGQFIILVRAGFKPGNIVVTASLPQRPDVNTVSISLKSVTVAPNSGVDMPAVDIDVPTQASTVPVKRSYKWKWEEALDKAWFKVPPVHDVNPGEMAETAPVMVGGEKSPLKMMVKDCEYRVYTSEWSSTPIEVKVGDALFFRAKASSKRATKKTAEIVIDGTKREWIVWNTPTPLVTASSEQSKSLAAYAFDGDLTTRWCASSSQVPAWCTVKMKQVQDVTKAVIVWEKEAAYQYKIEGSPDNKNWTILADRRDNRKAERTAEIPLKGEARYVRVTVTGTPSGCWASINEIVVQ